MNPILVLYSHTYLTAMGVRVHRQIARGDVSEEEFLRQEALRHRALSERPSWLARIRHQLVSGASRMRQFQFKGRPLWTSEFCRFFHAFRAWLGPLNT